VKGASSDGRVRDASPRFRSKKPGSPLSAEGKLRRAGMHCEEARFATGRNTVNPRIGSRAQQTCTVGEEQAAEVVRNHAGGTRERLAVAPRREPRRRGIPGAGLFDADDGGAIFGQTQERKSGRKVGPLGSRRDGTVGVKVRRVACARLRVSRTPVVGTSWTPARCRKATYGRSRRGAAKPDAAESTGGDSPRGGPRWVERTARDRSRRASAAPSESAWRCHTRWPRGEGKLERAERRVRPWRPDEPHTRPPGRQGPPRGGAGQPGLTDRCANL
jgi:hypothetical protein